MSSRAIIVFLSTAVLFSWTAAFSENSYDVLFSETPLHRQERAVLSFYQQKVSVHGGARCRFYPTCSAFYREALDRHGAFWATLMLLDRMLYREHGWSLEEYPVREDGELHVDPVYKNYIMNREGYYR
ncbi:MAG: membrane protein insertion efficiency factor YidD [Spirochaetes bacterium]|nr:membrane protein insertion efficiency factor YidD [Spirochaetota bacterium]